MCAFYPLAATVFHVDEYSRVEAARRLVEKYDFVITSGGIGPTHDGMQVCVSFKLPL